MLNNCECECEEERKSLKASSMQLTSTRNVQFGFACKVPLTRFNFLANFQSWGINLNSSCIIPILSIFRGRQESASGPGYGNKNVDTEQIRMMAGLFKTLLQFAFILVNTECVMMRSGRQGGHQHVIRNSILVKTIPGLSQLWAAQQRSIVSLIIT